MVGGDGVARGYLNRRELTEENFIEDPYRPGRRCYRTGDLALYHEDGSIEFLGEDHQVKIRGHRVEIAEITHLLRGLEEIRDVFITVVSPESQDKLCAYVVPGRDEIHAQQVRSRCKEIMPEYMIPAYFVIMDRLPLNVNGKVDTQQLPTYEEDSTIAAGYTAPRTEVEQSLSGIWSEVLNREKVGIYDNFFEIGGDSILAIQIISKAKEHGLVYTPQMLFQYRTIAELAVTAGTEIVESEQGQVQGEVPLTPIQHWFVNRELDESNHFNQSILLRSSKKLDGNRVKEALRRLVEHHDALRLRLTREQDRWVQWHADVDSSFGFEMIGLKETSEETLYSEIEQACSTLQQSLDLEKGPVVRAALFEIGEESRLFLAIHHWMVDGVSWRILIEDLQLAYEKLSRPEAFHLPRKTTSFQAWAKHMQTYAANEEIQQEKGYWLAEERTRAATLPVDYNRRTSTVGTAQTVECWLDEANTDLLIQEVPQAYHTQLQEILLTALAKTVSGWTGENLILVDLEGHGREDLFTETDCSRTVGWFTSIYPVCLEMPQSIEDGEAIKSVKETVRQVPRNGIGYGLLRYMAQEGIAEPLSQMPKAEISFNYLGQFDQVLSGLTDFELAEERGGSEQAKSIKRPYLLEVSGKIMGGRLQVVWQYSREVHQY